MTQKSTLLNLNLIVVLFLPCGTVIYKQDDPSFQPLTLLVFIMSIQCWGIRFCERVLLTFGCSRSRTRYMYMTNVEKTRLTSEQPIPTSAAAVQVGSPEYSASNTNSKQRKLEYLCLRPGRDACTVAGLARAVASKTGALEALVVGMGWKVGSRELVASADVA